MAVLLYRVSSYVEHYVEVFVKASELRDSSIDDLNGKRLDLVVAYFKLRMQKATGQLTQTHLLKQTRRDIARIKMVIEEKR